MNDDTLLVIENEPQVILRCVPRAPPQAVVMLCRHKLRPDCALHLFSAPLPPAHTPPTHTRIYLHFARARCRG